MFSVLIQNKKTIESFHEFHPLFLEALKKDVASCRWYESGTTIDAALPELSSITNDKEKWRAIIVHVENDEAMNNFEAAPDNPFDFACNKNPSDKLLESPVPLVRLTHMLGGVPKPEVKFETKLVENPGKLAQRVFIPTRQEEKEEAQKQLMEKYRYDGKLPSQIIVISIRCKDRAIAKDEVPNAWFLNNEMHSSDFWKRNNYPSNCRFIVYDRYTEGVIQKEADMFTFWTAVHLLATNDIEPSTLQAYRLYSVNVKFNHREMEQALRYRYGKILGLNSIADEKIKERSKDKESTELPKYERTATINPCKGDEEIAVSDSGFKMFTENGNVDAMNWGKIRIAAEEKLKRIVKKYFRALERTADKMGEDLDAKDIMDEPIDWIAKKELEANLFELFGDVIEKKGLLNADSQKSIENRDRLSHEIAVLLTNRLEKHPAIRTIIFLLLAVLIACVPAPFAAKFLQIGNGLGAGLWALIMAVVFAGTVFVHVLFEKLKVRKLIRSFNYELIMAESKLERNKEVYKEFLSGILSHIRGKKYISYWEKEEYKTQFAFDSVMKHFKSSQAMLEKLEKWKTAFHLDFGAKTEPDRSSWPDFSVSPASCSVYALDGQFTDYEVLVNESGERITTSFEFVRKIELRREELYDDEGTGN